MSHKPKFVVVNNIDEFKNMLDKIMSDSKDSETGSLDIHKLVEKMENSLGLVNRLDEPLNSFETEFLTMIHLHPLPCEIVSDMGITANQFIALHKFKKHGLVTKVDGMYVVSDDGKKHLLPVEPQVLDAYAVMTLICMTRHEIDLDELDDEDSQAMKDNLIARGFAKECPVHLHITQSGRDAVEKILATVV